MSFGQRCALLLVLLGIGLGSCCGPCRGARRCKAETAFVTLQYPSSSLRTNLSVEVHVVVDDVARPALIAPVRPGATGDTLEVEFPAASRYTTGSRIDVQAALLDNGNILARGQAATSLTAGCTTMTVALEATASCPLTRLPSVPTVAAASALAAADLDGDGLQDLVSAHPTSNSLRIFYGNGQGGFRTTTDVPLVNIDGTPYRSPAALALGSIVGRGQVDAVVAIAGSGSVILLAGQTGGSLGPPSKLFDSAAPQTLALGDIDRDGRLDVVAQGATTSELMVWSAAGSLRIPIDAQPNALVVADFNRDQAPDIAFSAAKTADVVVLTATAVAGFVSQRWSSGAAGLSARALAAAMLRRPDAIDLVVTHDTPGELAVLSGDGNGSFVLFPPHPAGLQPRGLVLDDFDGDGELDAAVSLAGEAAVALLHGHGDGTFDPAVYCAVGGVPGPMVAVDLSGDRHPDLAIGDAQSGTLTVLQSP